MQLNSTMSEFYYRAAREGATRKAPEDTQQKLKAAKDNAKGFSQTMQERETKVKQFPE